MNDMDGTVLAEPVETALARNRIYALLAQGFRYPDERTFPRLTDGTFAEALADAIEVCAADLAETFDEKLATDLMVSCSYDELQSACLSAFETNVPEPSASLYEGTYAHRENRPALLLELKGFYNNFGLRMAASVNDLEDTLTAELEFMQFLTAKQAQAEGEGLDSSAYLRAQRDFLERHLSIWLPALQADIAAKVKEPFYRALASLAAAFVAHDVEEVRGELERL